MNKITLSLIVTISLVSLMLSSCDKFEKPNVSTDNSGLQNSAIIIQTFGKVGDDANGTVNDDKSVHKMQGVGQPEVTMVTDTMEKAWPRTIRLTYDNTVDPNDGKTRNGVIEYTLTHRWSEDTATMIVSFIDFKVDSFKVSGRNLRLKRAGAYSYSILSDSTGIASGTFKNSVSLNLSVTQTIGMNTPSDKTDDVFETSGYAVSQDPSYAKKINIMSGFSLVKKSTCKLFNSGKIEILPIKTTAGVTEDQNLINFGNPGDNCDDKIIVTIGLNNFNLEIK